MAAQKPLLPTLEERELKPWPLMGLINGLLLGLTLALGAWLLQIIRLSQVPTDSPFGSVIVAGLLLLFLGSLAGWLSVKIDRIAVTILLWLAASILMNAVIGYQSNFIRTTVAWLTDGRLWGRPVYPTSGSFLGVSLAGFFVLLLFFFLAVFQGYRLEQIQQSLGRSNRVSFRTIWLLLLPLPLVALVGYSVTNITGGNRPGVAIGLVDRAITTALTYEGDLFDLALEEGLNYSALNTVRDQLTDDYVLTVGGEDRASAATFVVADFDNGAWIYCRIIEDQISLCSDAAPLYTIGFASLITGEPIPEGCLGCKPKVDAQWATWLAERGDRFGDTPQVTRLTQAGSYVLMEAESATEDYRLTCWFSGFSPVEIESCSEGE